MKRYAFKSSKAAAKAAIVYHAEKCVEALTCANTAEDNGMPGIATSLRKLAAYASDDAMRWVPHLAGNSRVVPA